MATISGKWTISSNADIASLSGTSVNFTSNGDSFTGMYIQHEIASYYLKYERGGGYITVCDSGNGNAWTNSAYRTVDFGSGQSVSDSFYNWFSSNATKQATTYTVTRNLTNVTASNTASSVTAGGSYSNTLTAALGYVLGGVTVRMGGTDITASAYSNGTINIGSVTGDIVITATAEKQATTYTVASTLTNVTASNTASSVTEGSAYSNTLTPDAGYAISGVTVRMGGTDITSSAYNNSNRSISISDVTGNIVITATATKQVTTCTVKNYLTNVTASNTASSVNKGSAYSNTLTPASGYTISKVTVTMGQTDITSSAYSNGTISISNVTGDIYISATARELYKFSITNRLDEDITSSNTATTVTEGNSYITTLTPSFNHAIKTVTVTMGGTDITASAYSNGKITINKVTSNIIITATAASASSLLSINYGGYTQFTKSNAATSVNNGDAYVCTLTPSDGYEITDISVTMGGTDITGKAVNGNTINISEVTYAVYVFVMMKKTSGTEAENFTVTRNLTNVTASNTANSATEGVSYSNTLTPASGYAISGVTVTMGGEDITTAVYNNGVITISAVTGNIVITATATAQLETYTITRRLTNVTASNTEASIAKGATYNCTLYVSSGYIISAISVTMGGEDITAAAYKNGAITISAVTGNIVIVATGTLKPEDIDPSNPTKTPTVYVICDKNCKFEGMTKEQIYSAIMQAVNEGTIRDVDAGFIQTIKTINGLPLRFFVGEQSQYDALSEAEKNNLFAIITNDATKAGITETLESLLTFKNGIEKGRPVPRAEVASVQNITSYINPNDKITATGLYLVSWKETGTREVFKSCILYIRSLTTDAYTSGCEDVYYNSTDRKIYFTASGYDIDTLTIWKIATHA